MANESQLAKIADIIRQHKGAGDPVSSAEISARADVDDGEGNPKTRRLILLVMDRYNIPIGANANGYFVIQSRAEKHEYLGRLFSRIEGIRDRIKLVRDTFEEGDIDVPETPLFPGG